MESLRTIIKWVLLIILSFILFIAIILGCSSILSFFENSETQIETKTYATIVEPVDVIEITANSNTLYLRCRNGEIWALWRNRYKKIKEADIK